MPGMHPGAIGNFAPGGTYLDTASYGLPPRATLAAIDAAHEQWRTGSGSWQRDWDPAGDECRRLLASIVGAPVDDVALMPAVSVGVAIAASLLRPGDEVLVPEDEFASLLLPLVVAEQRGARLRRVPYEELPGEVTARTALVACSHVRSNDGRTIDLDALCAAARGVGAPVLLDTTHSAGVLAIDAAARGVGIVVAAGYKHLLCPRGVGLLAVAPELRERIAPLCASWRALADPLGDYFGGGLDRLAAGAARYDVSLAWMSWVGARPALELLDSIPTAERAAWCVGLADRLAAALDLPPTGSSVLRVPIAAEPAALDAALDSAGLTVTRGREGVRVSFHLYNGPDDADLAAAVLRPLMAV